MKGDDFQGSRCTADLPHPQPKGHTPGLYRSTKLLFGSIGKVEYRVCSLFQVGRFTLRLVFIRLLRQKNVERPSQESGLLDHQSIRMKLADDNVHMVSALHRSARIGKRHPIQSARLWSIHLAQLSDFLQ